MIADHRLAATRGSDVHGDGFTQHTVGADAQPSRLALVVHRLRRTAERGERIDHGPRSNRRMPLDMNVRDEPTALADDDVRTDHAIGPDGDILADRARFDLRGRVYRCHASGPILTFASLCGALFCECWDPRTTSEIISASGALDLTFASRTRGQCRRFEVPASVAARTLRNFKPKAALE